MVEMIEFLQLVRRRFGFGSNIGLFCTKLIGKINKFRRKIYIEVKIISARMIQSK